MNTAKPKIGILGGGQLGMMLLQADLDELDRYKVLDPNPGCSCAHLGVKLQQGALLDYDTVYAFGRDCDIVTIEFEHINVDALKALEKEGVNVYPQAHIIEMVQDKGLQKEFYQKNNFPSGDFFLIEAETPFKKEWLPCVQKARQFGYDGKGVAVLKSETDLEKQLSGPCVIESLVDIKEELSVIVARSPSGEIKAFDPVSIYYHEGLNLVDYLQAPADIPAQIKNESKALATRLIETLDMVGILAVEMFLTPNNTLLINEIAPRPHNSGHQSIEANKTSQYRQHLNAIQDLPLTETTLESPAIMFNVLGEAHARPALLSAEVPQDQKVFIHDYHKVDNKLGRKMGHVTILGELESSQELMKTLKKFLGS